MAMRLSLDLRERTDRDGNAYLFTELPNFNLVLFVFDDGIREGLRRATLVLKPYKRRDTDYDEAWRDERDALVERRGPLPMPAVGRGSAPSETSEEAIPRSTRTK